MMSGITSLYPSMKIGISDLRVFAALDTAFAGDDFQISTDMHIHAYYEIIAVVSGEMRMDFTGHKSEILKADSVCLIPPGVYHCSGLVGDMPKKLAMRFTVSRTPDDTESAPIYETCAGILGNCREPVIFPEGRELVGLLDKMYSEMLTPEFASDTYIHLLLGEFFISVFRQLKESDRSSRQNILRQTDVEEQDSRYLRIENFFESRLSDQVTEQDLADHLNLSKRQTSRILMDVYHRSFRKILTDNRMWRAAQMLVTTDLPIDRIADRVGYTSTSGFYTAFELKFGVSAGKYRRENRQ